MGDGDLVYKLRRFSPVQVSGRPKQGTRALFFTARSSDLAAGVSGGRSGLVAGVSGHSSRSRHQTARRGADLTVD